MKEQAFSERGAAGVVAPGTTGPVPVAKVSAPSSKPSKDSKEAMREDASGNIQSLGVTIKKDQEDFGGWYKQVLTYGDMLDYYDVSGCYILKPASYGVWEMIQRGPDALVLQERMLTDVMQQAGSMAKSRSSELTTATSLCSYQQECWSAKRITSKVSLPRSHG